MPSGLVKGERVTIPYTYNCICENLSPIHTPYCQLSMLHQRVCRIILILNRLETELCHLIRLHKLSYRRIQLTSRLVNFSLCIRKLGKSTFIIDK